MKEINLLKFRGDKSRVFSGREEGKSARQKLNLDKLDDNSEVYLVIIPEDTISFNTSFFLGLFGNSIRKLGEKKFKEKYEFKCKDIIKRSIENSISWALKTSNPLE